MPLLLVSDKQNNLVVVLGREDSTIKTFATFTPKFRKLCPVQFIADFNSIECAWHKRGLATKFYVTLAGFFSCGRFARYSSKTLPTASNSDNPSRISPAENFRRCKS